jgi:hypothetical protein
LPTAPWTCGVLAAGDAPVRVDPTHAEVAEAALWPMRLLDRPAPVPVLHQVVLRLDDRLLASPDGMATRAPDCLKAMSGGGARGRDASR